MENLKSWGLMLLYISAGCLIYFFLLPSGNISKSARSIIGIIVMSVVCMPLFSVSSVLESIKTDFSQPPGIINPEGVIIEATEKEINVLIEDILKNYTDISYKTEIIIDIDEEYGINIEQITVYFSRRPENIRELRLALFEKLSIMPEIKVESESE